MAFAPPDSVASVFTRNYRILYDEDGDGVLSIAVERHDGHRVEIFEYGNDEEIAWLNLMRGGDE